MTEPELRINTTLHKHTAYMEGAEMCDILDNSHPEEVCLSAIEFEIRNSEHELILHVA